MKLTTLAFIVLLLSGCTSNKGLYDWKNYSETLYNYKKEPNNEKRTIHIKEINSIISEAEKKHKAVPPGLYAELAFYLLADGNKEGAIKNLELEKSHYPESTAFVNNLMRTL